MKGHIKERSPGHWAIILDIKKDGVRKRKWHSFRGSKKEAQVECAKLIAAMDEGSYVEKNKKLTVKQFLNDRLAAWEMAKRISPKSVERYRELIDNQIAPHFGAKPLQSVRAIDIENWHAALIASGRKDGKGGLSPRSIGHAHRLLSRMLQEATKFGLVVKNPAIGSELPKVQAAEVQIVSEVQLPVLLEKIKGNKIELIVLLALFCGLRRGEILALTWGNIDLDSKVLQVRRSLEETREHGPRFKSPKSKAGRRDLTIPDIVVDVLRKHRIAQLELRAKLGLGRPSDDGLLFQGLSGQPIGPRHFSANLWPAVARSVGMSSITFHALRHTHASQLIAAGVDVVTISKRLGHSSPNITLSVYAHLFSASDEKAARAINDALGKIR